MHSIIRTMTWVMSLVLLLAPLPAAAEENFDSLLAQIKGTPDLCRDHLEVVHGGAAGDVRHSIEEETGSFKSLAERALALRAATIKVGRQLLQKIDHGRPLSGRDLDLLSQGLNEHLKLRKELLEVAEAHECWLDLEPGDLEEAGLSRQDRLQGVSVSLAAALVLYDNYLLAISLYEGDPKLRRLVNQKDPAYDIHRAELAKVTLNYNSLANRSRVRRALAFFEEEKGKLSPLPETEYLAELIAQSPSCDMIRQWSPLYLIGKKLGFLGGLNQDLLKELERDGVSLFSMVFGNMVGLVETRKGKLYQKPEIRGELLAELRCGDILLEKTPFRLTDKLIPGYWGHAAVWIGSEKELKELGIWDHPLVIEHRDAIRSGRQVVEALRSGVEMNTLDQFLNIDSIGILRRPGLAGDQRAAITLRALRQVGKPYDFNFDVESKEAIYCSKLVYFTHQGVNWSPQRAMGRTTFTPDDVALGALETNSLELVEFYHDGQKITESPLQRMAGLMETLPAR